MNKVHLLLHGRGNQADGLKSAFFPDLKNYLEAQGYQIITPNLSYAKGVSTEDTLEEIDALVAQAHPDKLSIVGHSSGGYLACQVAMKYKLNKLVMIAPTNPSDYFSSHLIGLVDGWLQGEPKQHYYQFHKHTIDFQTLEHNTNQIQCRFGAKDEAIDTDIRIRYANHLAQCKSIKFSILPDRGHMGADEGITSLSEIYTYL